MTGLPYYNTGTVSASSGSADLTFSGSDIVANAAIGYGILLPDGPSSSWSPHVLTAIGTGTASIVPNTAAVLSGDAFYIFPLSGMSSKAVADLNTLLNSSNYSDIASISPSSNDFLEYISGAWTNRTPIQTITKLFSTFTEVNVASASTCDIGASGVLSPKIQITGTTTITSFGTSANCYRIIRFAGSLTLTHNATSLILLGGVNRTTAADDIGIYSSDSSGNWRELSYVRRAVDPNAFSMTAGYSFAVTLTGNTGVTFPTSGTLAETSSGTFTPGLDFGGATTGITFASRSGKWIRFGKLYLCLYSIQLSSKGSAIGTAHLTGLPATVGSTPSNPANGEASTNISGIPFVMHTLLSGTTTAVMNGPTSATNLQNTDFTDSSVLNGSFWFITN